MEFCPTCESILYYQEEDGDLINFCQSCGFKDKSNKTLIAQNSYAKNAISAFGSRKNYVYDPTFPRTAKYICPNEDCITRQDDTKKEAIFFNEGDSLKHVFICKACQTEWKY